MSDQTRRHQIISDTVKDLVEDLLYDDRKEDDELRRGEIEESIRSGEITVDEIVAIFRSQLLYHVGP